MENSEVMAEGVADTAFPDVMDATLLETPATIAPGGLEPISRAVELLQAGGPVVAILLILSITALAIILVKLWQFSHLGIGRSRAARAAAALYREGRVQEAEVKAAAC